MQIKNTKKKQLFPTSALKPEKALLTDFTRPLK